MKKEEFLARCELIFDLGMLPNLKIAKDYVEATERFLGYQKEQFQRIVEKHRTRQEGKTLYNDREGYKALERLYILTNSCQKCSTDKESNHRASGFCPHIDKSNLF